MDMAEQPNLPIVPDGCIPLIGYVKKPSTMLLVQETGRNFLEERDAAISVCKKNHKISYKKIRTKQKKSKFMTSQTKERKSTTQVEVQHTEEHTVNERNGLQQHTFTNLVSSARSSKV